MFQRDGKSHFQRGSIISLIRSVSNMDHLKSNQSVLEERKSRADLSGISEDGIDINVEVVEQAEAGGAPVLGRGNGR